VKKMRSILMAAGLWIGLLLGRGTPVAAQTVTPTPEREGNGLRADRGGHRAGVRESQDSRVLGRATGGYERSSRALF
jgi:hypothetical protein